MILALRDTQWQALLVISPLIVAVLSVYGYVLYRGFRVIWSGEDGASEFEDLCANIFATSAVMVVVVLVFAWIWYAVYLWKLER